MSGRPVAPGRIRIIGGSLRNSRLEVAEQVGLRPTGERVRETLFNWLAPMLPGARALDLYAGTGALGIEALSRGAGSVDFVERDTRAAQALRANLLRLKQSQGQVHAGDALTFLHGAARRYDLVFIDPPFDQTLWQDAAQTLERGGRLSAQAWIYLEMPHAAQPLLPPNWQLHRHGQTGAVKYLLYRRTADLS